MPAASSLLLPGSSAPLRNDQRTSWIHFLRPEIPPWTLLSSQGPAAYQATSKTPEVVCYVVHSESNLKLIALEAFTMVEWADEMESISAICTVISLQVYFK